MEQVGDGIVNSTTLRKKGVELAIGSVPQLLREGAAPEKMIDRLHLFLTEGASGYQYKAMTPEHIMGWETVEKSSPEAEGMSGYYRLVPGECRPRDALASRLERSAS